MFALDDRLVHSGPAGYVIGLDREEFLERIGGAVRLHGPDLHLSEALAAELCLASQRLLGNQAVGTDGTGMDLVVHQVVELQDVHYAHGNLVFEGVSGPAVIQRDLPGRGK